MAPHPGTPAERADELTTLLDVLDRRAAALIALVGSRGSGKSFVTAEFADAAARLGWQVTPYKDGRGLRVSTGTTAEQLATDVRSAVGLPAPRGHRHPLRRVADDVAEAATRQPVLIVLDPYAPDADFVIQLREEFLDRLRAAPAPVVITVVSRRPQHELEPTLELRIDRPDEDHLRVSLRNALEATLGDWTDDELDAYVAAARANTRLLTSLLTVLPLAPLSSRASTEAAHVPPVTEAS